MISLFDPSYPSSLLLMLLLNISPFIFLGNIEKASLSARSDQPVNHTQISSPVSEFRSHMLRAIGKFPISRQCAILEAILKDSGEIPSRVMNDLIDIPSHQHLSCIPTTSPSGSPVNTSGLRDATDRYITR